MGSNFATDLVIIPGLVDLSARLREPGFEHKATLESEMNAAAAGGVTSLAKACSEPLSVPNFMN